MESDTRRPRNPASPIPCPALPCPCPPEFRSIPDVPRHERSGDGVPSPEGTHHRQERLHVVLRLQARTVAGGGVGEGRERGGKGVGERRRRWGMPEEGRRASSKDRKIGVFLRRGAWALFCCFLCVCWSVVGGIREISIRERRTTVVFGGVFRYMYFTSTGVIAGLRFFMRSKITFSKRCSLPVRLLMSLNKVLLNASFSV